MNTGAASRRYARALYELAAEEDAVEAVQVCLESLSAGIAEVAADALAPGALGADARQQLGEKLAAKYDDVLMFAQFVRVLASADRLVEAPRIAQSFAKMKDDAEGRVRAAVITAAPFSDESRRSLENVLSRLAGKQVIPEVEVDEALLGGVIVELEGRVYDGSVRSGLRRLSERMAGGTGKSAA